MNVETFALGSFTYDVAKVVDVMFQLSALLGRLIDSERHYNSLEWCSTFTILNPGRSFGELVMANISINVSQFFIHKSLLLISFANLLFLHTIQNSFVSVRSENWR